MSNINHKGPKTQIPPGFGPLNHRKTVGNTYGERREKAVENPQEKGGWQIVKDFFSGDIKPKNIQNFSNNTDRYETSKTNKIDRVQQGTSHTAGISRPSNDQYAGYLYSIMQYFDTKKKV